MFKSMKAVVLIAVAMSSAQAFAARAPAQAAPAAAAADELQTVTTVVADLIVFENGIIIRRPPNEGKALKIQDAMALSADKIRFLQSANESKVPVRFLVKGTVVVDILLN